MRIALLLGVLSCASAQGSGQDVELGRVAWMRALEPAFERSERTGAPVFLLFQEIPGCSTCRGFGQGPLSHPLLVEAIETEFVPLAIHNNRGGEDARVLELYGEPAWNNPVVRFFGPDREELLPRRDGVWTARELSARMILALEAAGRDVPAYLTLAEAELRQRDLERAVLAMPCFWAGEAELGGQPGVLGTRPGWLDGREVVEVRFDPAVLPFEELVRAADGAGCATRVYAASDEQLARARKLVGDRAVRVDGAVRDAAPGDRRFHLQRTAYDLLPLTPLQAQRINAALAAGRDPSAYLGPRQRELLTAVEAAPEGRLRGLERPETIADLADYEARLRERLGGS